MNYTVEIDRTASKEIAALPRPVRARVARAIAALEFNPRPIGCKKLVGGDLEYRIRIGDWRVVYEIHDARVVVRVINVAHRREIYR